MERDKTHDIYTEVYDMFLHDNCIQNRFTSIVTSLLFFQNRKTCRMTKQSTGICCGGVRNFLPGRLDVSDERNVSYDIADHVYFSRRRRSVTKSKTKVMLLGLIELSRYKVLISLCTT